MTVALERRRFTVEEYHRMAAAGILGEDDRVELLEGEIVRMSPIGKAHAACVKRLNLWFGQRLAGRVLVSIQDPIRLGDRSEPQPDVALLKPRDDQYAKSLPTVKDVLLVIEVADTTAESDRDVKLPLYARAGIPETWLVIIPRRIVEVHRNPGPDGYATVTTHPAGDTIAPVAFPGEGLGVAELVRDL